MVNKISYASQEIYITVLGNLEETVINVLPKNLCDKIQSAIKKHTTMKGEKRRNMLKR